ncbi:MAG: transporter substrate-binding domain-containing protein, partial [Anaerolineae bacterium]
AVGRVDVLLSGLPVDPARTGEVAYSVSYFNAGQALVTTRPDIQSVDDLAGQEVAVEWGSLADMEARRLSQTIPGLRLAPHPDAATAMQSAIAVVDGVSALSNPRLRLVAYLSDTPYAAAVTVQNKELLAQVNRTFTRLIEGGEMARLQQKWLAVN